VCGVYVVGMGTGFNLLRKSATGEGRVSVDGDELRFLIKGTLTDECQ